MTNSKKNNMESNEIDLLKQPWAIRPELLNVFTGIAQKRMAGEQINKEELNARIGLTAEVSEGYYVANGIAFVPISGVIGKASSWWVDVSVEQIQTDFTTALNDTNVKKIVLLIDSPGGSVMGTPELSDFIFAQRGKKPVIAYAQGMMCSGAYFIGCSADQIFASKASIIGSIGVYTMLYDISVMLHNWGVKTNLIKAGRFKAAGNSSSPLTEDEKAVIQEEINSYYELFVETVMRGRGISEERTLELATGRCWIGQKAVDAGLVDGIKTFDEIISSEVGAIKKTKTTAVKSAHIENSFMEHTSQQEEKTMDKEKLKKEHKALHDEVFSDGKAAAVAEEKQGKEAAVAAAKTAGFEEGKNAAMAAEKNRVSGILSAMPKGMHDVAIQAIKDGLSVEQAKDAYLQKVNASAPASLGNGDDPQQAPKAEENTPEAWGKQYDSDPKIRAEFSSKESYVGFKKAESAGRVKRLAK